MNTHVRTLMVRAIQADVLKRAAHAPPWTELRGIRIGATGAWNVARRWPEWWQWELELSPHLLKRMVDRRFTEVDLRRMLEVAQRYRRDVVENRWVVMTRHRRRQWEIVVEPDWGARLLVVVTAYPIEE